MKKLFEPGKSGNPAGRPRGLPDKRNQYRLMLEPHVPEILTKLAGLAKDGDVAACKLVLERTVPAVRPGDIPSSVPFNGATMAERGQALINAAAAAELSLSDAETGMALLNGQARLAETSDLLRRIELLEERVK